MSANTVRMLQELLTAVALAASRLPYPLKVKPQSNLSDGGGLPYEQLGRLIQPITTYISPGISLVKPPPATSYVQEQLGSALPPLTLTISGGEPANQGVNGPFKKGSASSKCHFN